MKRNPVCIQAGGVLLSSESKAEFEQKQHLFTQLMLDKNNREIFSRYSDLQGRMDKESNDIINGLWPQEGSDKEILETMKASVELKRLRETLVIQTWLDIRVEAYSPLECISFRTPVNL